MGQSSKTNNNSSNPTNKKKERTIRSCIFCRRSHVVCDEGRPCSRCIKRDIAHLCKLDEDAPTVTGTLPSSTKNPSSSSLNNTPNDPNIQSPAASFVNNNNNTNTNMHVDNILAGLETGIPSLFLQQQPNFISENVGSEFSSLNEFLTMLENPLLVNPAALPPDLNTNTNTSTNGISVPHTKVDPNTNYPAIQPKQPTIDNATTKNNSMLSSTSIVPNISTTTTTDTNVNLPYNTNNDMNVSNNNITSRNEQVVQEQETENGNNISSRRGSSRSTSYEQAPTPREQFFLTAADPSTEITPEDRLKLVINAKLEAGLLKPYDYAKGYGRLQRYMDDHMDIISKQRILKPLSSIRPAFRSIARSLKDLDLMLVEENFERLLLSYDRVFTSMSMPACLWRRTGEIYRANKEFAMLVDCTVDELRDGKLAVYELMTEESAVNFWEKYGSIAFDKGQKAVLTSCHLKTRNGDKECNCCFSFTIRRDRYNIPICIVGNFIPIT
ncbi:gluconeogenesis transcription factor RDS2 NDAI_0E02270 [Naumovozyma dairenensis CBS 421]|uniref:Zn(2)-C6 fungal-type domain-containing protein n=1 Tax=Naumovozyma dairenensis (strain ATCC 10597 / BCRC 20456 / CBS 421 / NBRC 0211 / NRRL Y-12639) TaxID=1071378 RepID=G0WBC4_NAUDC|nr:hypothetical protein NDAI_0E02270 [Naumovozyma dairenensis CBS 421]CCD25044.1 hypothetical protein NDAI_0E02270 [Naumovozyma dairenensis CBS 421]